MQTYYYVLASQHFLLEEEPLEEVLRERVRNYHEQEKEIDFWLVKQPAFLETPSMGAIKAKCPQPAVAIISTNSQFITWLKLRLEYVLTGEFTAPNDEIYDALASLATVS
ncbi:Histone acetyltransferase HPA2 and related acetyltransferases [Richelia intracellularis]|nr:Histone acetyltransferase HPA2 and related acetyltransferases [Richelia intracellularis]